MARDYELGLVIKPDVGDDQARAIVDRVTQTVASNSGQVVRVNAWGRRRLAYPIEHHRDGLYFFFDLIMPPESVGELERTLHVNESVMRHLVKLRDPRIAAQQRQREAEAEAQAAVQAAQAAAAAEAAAAQAAEHPAAEPEAPGEPAETPAVTAQAAEEAPAEEAPETAEAVAGEASAGEATEEEATVTEADESAEDEAGDVAATSEAEAHA
jgi:small subunit ribosomal protein S6